MMPFRGVSAWACGHHTNLEIVILVRPSLVYLPTPPERAPQEVEPERDRDELRWIPDQADARRAKQKIEFCGNAVSDVPFVASPELRPDKEGVAPPLGFLEWVGVGQAGPPKTLTADELEEGAV